MSCLFVGGIKVAILNLRIAHIKNPEPVMATSRPTKDRGIDSGTCPSTRTNVRKPIILLITIKRWVKTSSGLNVLVILKKMRYFQAMIPYEIAA